MKYIILICVLLISFNSSASKVEEILLKEHLSTLHFINNNISGDDKIALLMDEKLDYAGRISRVNLMLEIINSLNTTKGIVSVFLSVQKAEGMQLITAMEFELYKTALALRLRKVENKIKL